MTRDRVTVERLETLLDQARQESINAQATNQELQNEISRLKQKVSELQNKLYASHYITLFYYFYIIFKFTFTFTDPQNPQSLDNIRIKRRNIVNRSVSSVDRLPMRDLIVRERKNRVAGILSRSLKMLIFSPSRILSSIVYCDRFQI